MPFTQTPPSINLSIPSYSTPKREADSQVAVDFVSKLGGKLVEEVDAWWGS
jgi:hypothetical protein